MWDCDDGVLAHTIAKKYESGSVGGYSLDTVERHIGFSLAVAVYGSSNIVITFIGALNQ